MERVTLYSPQAQVVWDVLKEQDTAYCRREYIQKKYQEVSRIFLTAYDAYVREAEKIVPRSAYAESPYWAFISPKDLDASAGGSVMQLKLPLDEAVFFDMYDWYKVLKLSYMPASDAEEAAFSRELALRGIRNESDIFLTAFYPDLKRKVIDSWKKLFRWDSAIKEYLSKLPEGSVWSPDEKTGLPMSVQAGIWCIKKEWLENSL